MQPTRLRGARTNNLRSLDVDLQPGTLVAIAGPSGAGKSSLAFGTLYAEGQRRYVESFSAYARQFLERMARPPVDELEPVPAAVAVDRQAPVRTSRSTVGTMTEVNDYAKSLWARAAVLICPRCGRTVERDDPQAAATAVLEAAAGARAVVTFPAVAAARSELLGQGYRRVLVEGAVVELDTLDDAGLDDAAVLHVVADRLVVRAEERSRLVEALEAAMSRGGGHADVWVMAGGSAGMGQRLRFSRGLHCSYCDLAFRQASAGLFSFNSAIGACPTCRGFGRTTGVDMGKVIPDPSLSLAKGAIKPWQSQKTAWERRELKGHCKRAGVPWDAPVASFTRAQQRWLMDGDEHGWMGIRGWFAWLESRSYKMHVRVFLARYRSYDLCPACQGTRLKPEALHWRLGGASIAEFLAMPAGDALGFIEARTSELGEDAATGLLLRECAARLRALCDVGLEYVTLDRASRTLSGGEAQRVALTSALGAALSGAMIVLDEPTVGLHPRDVGRLARVIRRLATGDNLAVVVEHDPVILRSADRVIELGPGAGSDGGAIVFDGSPRELLGARTATGKALARAFLPVRPVREPQGWLRLVGARGNNLADVSVRVPLGVLTCVTGVSGSGKSSLIIDTLAPAVRAALDSDSSGERTALPFERLEGAEAITQVIEVDQAPLGRTSRGNPATYIGAWDLVRKLLSKTPVAQEREYTPGMFSFNVTGGRCEACKGEGAETVEMQFLADVSFSCPECGGRRFVGEVLDVRVCGYNVADILDLTVSQAYSVFSDSRMLIDALRPLIEVGLGYLRLGQPLSTLSGGEAQRLKLAHALAGAPGGSLIILDEPTAGLHAADVEVLMTVLERLVTEGQHTVVVIEHDMNVAARADHVIELGPGAGAAGGRIVATGAPAAIARESTATAPYLAMALGLVTRAADSAPDSALYGAGLAETGLASRLAGESGRSSTIAITGAREHNLKNVSVEVPREQLVVVTGPSGSGKSTLAFDILFAEGQRRYLETLSPYARQYMPQLPRPAVDRVVGVPPSVALEQRVTRGGGNSTVATITEVAHYLRVLYARAGLWHCPTCRVPIAPRSPAQMAEDLRERFAGHQVEIYAPLVHGRKGSHKELLRQMSQQGYQRLRIDGELVELGGGKADKEISLDRYREHDIDVQIAVLAASDAELGGCLTQATSLGNGAVRVVVRRGGKAAKGAAKASAGAVLDELSLSTKRACPSCGRGFAEPDPRLFSFNTRQGACPVCQGAGELERPDGTFRVCTGCEGTRLSPLARSVLVADWDIAAVMRMSISAAHAELATWLAQHRITGRAAEIASVPLTEAVRRLAFLEEVGVGYLTLERSARTLSGGEMQRVRLAAQLGSGLTGVLYVLDEPTIGLHPRDTRKLLGSLRALVDRGNSVVVVEHDTDAILAADMIIDVGPGGGRNGGRIVAQGSPNALLRDPSSVTGPALARPAMMPSERRSVAERPWIELVGAREHNLKDVDVRVPLGVLTCVTGVSGSGKTTLIREVLLRAVRAELDLATESPGAFRRVAGAEQVRQAVEIDQSPIGRTSRSVPATYIGIWDQIRKLLAQTPEARARGYGPSRFSFNTKEGACPECEGQGALTVEMSFLPDVLMPCEACAGMRFDPETLEVTWHGLNAGQILDLDTADAAELFASTPRIARPLALLVDLGLGYLKLGQPSGTLSGGEAQRLKLVSELSARSGARTGTRAGAKAGAGTLYIMDEPTTGLHRDDVARLIAVLGKLVERGDTVVVIEHHLDVMTSADWIIDLGPEGGEGGGRVVIAGTPEQVAACAESHTGRFLAEVLGSAVTADKPPETARNAARKPRSTAKAAATAASQTASRPAGKAAAAPKTRAATRARPG